MAKKETIKFHGKKKKEHDDNQAIEELIGPVQLESKGALLINCMQWHKLTPEAFPT